MNSLNVISAIVQAIPSIGFVSFHEFPKQKLVQDSGIEWGEKEQFMFDRALQFKQIGMPFWDGVMLSCFNNPNVSKLMLQQALRHNTHPRLTCVSRDKLSLWIKENISVIDSLAFCSKVITTTKEEKHLPLIDFHIPVSDTNVNVVEIVCHLLGLEQGWILNSGESYHFIGSQPICRDELERLLYKAIMFTPIIDKAWISHQLREGSCSLRVGKKRGEEPVVVKKIEI